MARKSHLKSCSFCSKQVYRLAQLNPALCANCYYRQQRNGSPAYQDRSPKPCKVDGCADISVAECYCDKHYRRFKRFGDPLHVNAEKWGHRHSHPLHHTWTWLSRMKYLCDEWKDFWAFVAAVGERPDKYHRIFRDDKNKPYGPGNFRWRNRAIDIPTDNKSNRNHRQRVYRLQNADKFRDADLRKIYGIGLSEYNKMLKKQDGVCAICLRPERRIHKQSGKLMSMAVDHCHKTGVIRGILCSNCNLALGSFDDDTSIIRNAIKYLERHRALHVAKK